MRVFLGLACIVACVSAGNMDKYHKRTGEKFLKAKEAEEGVHKLPSGMLFKVLNKGSGSKSPGAGDQCDVHYSGTLRDGTKFDSSYDRGQPTAFAPNQVIKGWTEALQLMCEGDKWQLYIPYEMAYGERGSPPKIPGFSPLIFDVELIKVKEGGKPCEDAKASLTEKLGDKAEEL
eukprot:TRINITY_DN17264_c0_g1_i1.p1 TRINITY_DN17264_c0_g1~~TRINITY_DN17264_c0_g1_i1.p1  ORF type:complete len:175 (+),score=46.26 TRINITY_DN17264_c0_g1_i1:155-679(+)